ncbi:hypothetical protein Tco_1515548 [Tanacetum coccineum]
MTEVLQIDSGLAVPVVSQEDDPIACLNKEMVFLTVVASSRFPLTNNQLRTSFNPRNQATIQDGKVTVQQVQGVKAKLFWQCTQPKRLRNAVWFKEKVMLAKALEARQILDEEKLAFLTDPGTPDGQAIQTTIQNNDAFQTEDLDAYDSDCDDVLNAKAVLMANLSNYGSNVISEVPHSETYHNDMDNQSMHAMQDFEQTPVVDFSNNEIHSDSNIILYSQYLQEPQQVAVQDTNLYAQQDSLILSVIEQMSEQIINHCLNIDLSSREKIIDSQMDDMIKEKLALKQLDSPKQNLSNQIKEKESLLQTFTVFKNESKGKETKYKDNEIDLEKKIKEFVISSEHVAMPVIDDDETLILEEVSRSKMSEKFHMSNPSTESSDASPVKVEVPSELPKVSLVNESLKKIKFHLAKFDSVVKIKTTPDALTEVDKQCFEIVKKELFLKNDRLLQKIMSRDVLLSVMNSITLNGESVNVNMQRSESYDKCFNLDAELSKTQNAYNDLLKKYFENNDLKAQLQEKDTTVCKLKELIKSMRENNKEQKVNHDISELETINKELESSVA